MNKTKILGLVLPLLVGGTTGCQVSSDEHTAPSAATFALSGRISPLTKAPQLDADGGGRFVDGDRNTVFFYSAAENIADGFSYTYGEKYLWSQLPLTSHSADLSVSACYPAVETGNPKNFEWNISDNKQEPDFLLSAPVAVKRDTPRPVALTFTHALHKLKVNIQADGTTMTEGQLADILVQCRNVQSVARLDLLQGKVLSASGPLSSVASKGPRAEFIVPAQEVGSMSLQIRLGAREQVYDLAQCKIDGTPLTRLESGKSLVLNITVSEKEFTITGQEISGWGNQGEVNDSIII